MPSRRAPSQCDAKTESTYPTPDVARTRANLTPCSRNVRQLIRGSYTLTSTPWIRFIFTSFCQTDCYQATNREKGFTHFAFYGIRSNCPTLMLLIFAMLLAEAIAATVVLCLIAMDVRVSPDLMV